MIQSRVRRSVGALIVATLMAQAGWGADQTRPTAPSNRSANTSAAKAGTARPSAKGPLPDPALLDGSTLQAEKRPEHGMIGDFELPGDDNSRSGKVGGPQGQPGGQGGQGGQQPQQPPGVSVSLPNPLGLPMPGGGASTQTESAGLPSLPDPTKQGGAAGAQDSAGAIPPAGGAGAQGAQQSQSAGGAAGGPAGSPDGMQVGGLQGEASAGGENSGGATAKPSPVSIGDSAMRIEPSANPAASGGQNQQIAGQTQQHEKGTGSGGKGSGGASSGNRAEKGRVIPAGL